MNILEVKKLLKENSDLNEEQSFFYSSSNVDQLLPYLSAWTIKNSRTSPKRKLRFLSNEFGTLRQSLMSFASENQEHQKHSILFLTPWDFVSEFDWRTGCAVTEFDFESKVAEIESFLALISSANIPRAFYLKAATCPLGLSEKQDLKLKGLIENSCLRMEVELIDSQYFSMKDYLATGQVISSRKLSEVAQIMTQSHSLEIEKKVLVTDLDQTLWRGILGEDGIEGISYASEGTGFPHFIYQSFLKKLKAQGIVLLAVSKNDPDLVEQALRSELMTVKLDDFTSIVASYEAKSAQIQNMASELNLGLDSFVFVDDNPVEINEVRIHLSDVTCIRFPETIDEFENVIKQLHTLFSKQSITEEDRKRVASYRARKKFLDGVKSSDGSIDSYLKTLSMKLEIFDRSKSENERAIQLINKTNQFNLNGFRLSREEIEAIIGEGGSLITAKMSDNGGNFGEVVACLIDSSHKVLSWVMSCRVFQRKIELAFLHYLNSHFGNLSFDFHETSRNSPFAKFKEEVLMNQSLEQDTLKSAWEMFDVTIR